MDMAPGRVAARADGPDYVALANGRPHVNAQFLEVRVEGLRIVRGADDDVTRVPAIPATGTRDDNAPGCGSDHGHAAGIREVNAVIPVNSA